MHKKQVIIIGAGLAGLSAAWHLEQRGFDPLVLEKESEPGGLCRSKEIGDFRFDYDGHLLHLKHAYTRDFINKFMDNNLVEHTRSAWIYKNNSFSAYPFQANLYSLPKQRAMRCYNDFLKTHTNNKRKRPESFHNWVLHTFGNSMAKEFFFPYNQKFWNFPLKKMNCDWVDGFIPVPNKTEVKAGLTGTSDHQFGYNATFWYPQNHGIGELARLLANQVSRIFYRCAVQKIDFKHKIVYTKDKKSFPFDILISTIPLPDMTFVLSDYPVSVLSAFKRLRWNSIFNLNLGLTHDVAAGKHWIYFPEKKFSFFRVGFYSHFSDSASRKGAAMYVETAYKPGKLNRLMMQRKNISDLIRLGFLSSQRDIACIDQTNIDYGYPIYDANYSSATARIHAFLESNRIFSCGRYGQWKYMSMEDVLLQGALIAKKIGEKT